MERNEDIAAAVEQAIEEMSADPDADHSERFSSLALTIFTWQFEHNEVYQKFCTRRSHTPRSVADWRDIPALPTSAFKEVDLACGKPERVFLTSGTTQGTQRRGRHLMPRLSLYRGSALPHFRRMVLPDGVSPHVVALLAGPEIMPDSSLVQMVEWIGADTSKAEVEYLVASEGFNATSATARLRKLASEGRPLCLIGVRAVFTALFDHLNQQATEIELPANSRIVDTGGPKGGRTLSDGGFLHASWKHLGIPGYYCINEYGMTELSSQYYDDVLWQRFSGSNERRRKLAPPWLRSVAVDPETLECLPDGEMGLVRHVDLANALSVLAVQTDDLGVVEGANLELRGRSPGAEPRGCALALSHLLEVTG